MWKSCLSPSRILAQVSWLRQAMATAWSWIRIAAGSSILIRTFLSLKVVLIRSKNTPRSQMAMSCADRMSFPSRISIWVGSATMHCKRCKALMALYTLSAVTGSAILSFFPGFLGTAGAGMNFGSLMRFRNSGDKSERFLSSAISSAFST
ncbi:hypothetical protein BGZ63DRAFT_379201 [Mariannaea sp. PMI_226]|nr:hypothetical protein BGZ63DRAFT_379201 [Mariannaea sp. PMI_226]